MVALHILQAALVYVNTLMIQEVLAQPEWVGVLTDDDRRGLTPLFWTHILPYGEARLNMAHRLALSDPTPPPEEGLVGAQGPRLVGLLPAPLTGGQVDALGACTRRRPATSGRF